MATSASAISFNVRPACWSLSMRFYGRACSKNFLTCVWLRGDDVVRASNNRRRAVRSFTGYRRCCLRQGTARSRLQVWWRRATKFMPNENVSWRGSAFLHSLASSRPTTTSGTNTLLRWHGPMTWSVRVHIERYIRQYTVTYWYRYK